LFLYFLALQILNLGVIAPTAEGYFDLVINFAQVDVSFDYEILIAVNDTNPESVVLDLVATKYTINGGSDILFGSEQKITGHISYEEDIFEKTNPQITIRVHVVWDDSSTASMNNAADTLTTITVLNQNKFAILDVTASFTQTPSITTPEPEEEP